jgi:hypothetical protein
MTATKTATPVLAAALIEGDRFDYHGTQVTVQATTTLEGGRLVEVHVIDPYLAQDRYLDHGVREEVMVTGGPSYDAALRAEGAHVALSQRVSPSQRARDAVRLGKVRALPTSAALVLYAVAAAEEEAGADYAPTVGSIATGAGLAIGTVQGYLRTLARKGLVRESGMGWTLA